MTSAVACIDPEIQGGVPCFVGTRVPIAAFFDYVRESLTLEEFLTDFPSVTREQALQLLKELGKTIEQTADATAG